MESKARTGDWMQTASGGQFWPIDPRVEEVFIWDIAHSLSNQCRFAGHCRTFYSVAEHSVRVSQIVPEDEMLAALLHDAAEAYLVDLPRPVKRSPGIGPHYEAAEARVAFVIEDRYGLVPGATASPAIKIADNRLLMTEARDLMAKPSVTWKESGSKTLEQQIVPWAPGVAHLEFLRVFCDLTGVKDFDEAARRMIAKTRGGRGDREADGGPSPDHRPRRGGRGAPRARGV